MSGWSRTVKPSADKTLDANVIVGADALEVAANPGIAHAGWVVQRQVGTRTVFETLVAMRTPPTEDNADDTILPDVAFTFIGPDDVTVDDGDPFTLSSTVTPTTSVNVTYQWWVSTDGGDNWAQVVDDLVYSGAGTTSLVVSDSTGLDGDMYRLTAESADAGVAGEDTSNPATVTVVTP